MNITSKITTVAVLAAATCSARELQWKVPVCVSHGTSEVREVIRAQATASEIFAAIGVKLDWRFCPKSGEQGTIVINLYTGTPAHRKPGELAHTSPKDG